jgi:hypothetical protein
MIFLSNPSIGPYFDLITQMKSVGPTKHELIIQYPGVIQLVFREALSRFRIKQWFRLVFSQAGSITKIFCSVHLNQRSDIRKGVNGLWAKMVLAQEAQSEAQECKRAK